jgi:hypothetical protein
MITFVSSVQVYESLQDSTVKNDSAGSIIQPISLQENKSTSFTALKTSVLFGQSTPTTTASSTPITQSSQSYSQKPAPATSSQQKVTSASFATKALPQFVPTSVSTGTLFDQLSVTPTQGQQSTSPSVFSFQSSAESSVLQVTPDIFFSSPQTSPQQSFPFPQQLSETTHPKQLIASSKLNSSNTSQTNLTSVFSHPQSSSATIFGQQAPSPPAVTSLFGQQTSQPVSQFSSIDSTPKTTFIMPPLGSCFAALGSKPVPTASTGSSETTKPKPVSISFSSALGLKSTVTPSTKASIHPGFSVMHSTSSGTSEPKHSGSNFSKTTEAAESSFQAKEGEGVPFLPFDSSLSFANLASKSDKPGFKTGKNS